MSGEDQPHASVAPPGSPNEVAQVSQADGPVAGQRPAPPLMPRMGRIAGGWLLAKESWRLLRADRSLALFPVLSALATLAAAAVIWTPVAIVDAGHDKSPVAAYVALGVSLYVLTFIAVFFGTALAAAAALSLDGKDTTLADGLSVAIRRLPTILVWSLVQSVVGALIHLIEGLGRWSRSPLAIVALIIGLILGAAWSVMTFFVIPILALEELGPIGSIKRSWSVIRKHWGETVVGSFSIGAVIFLALLVPVSALGGLGISLLPAHEAIGITLVAVAGLVFAAGVLANATLNSIFRVALYRYATAGNVGPVFDQQLLARAFKTT